MKATNLLGRTLQSCRGHIFGFLILAELCCPSIVKGDNRLLINAEIDHKPVHLIFDTGWSGRSVILFGDAVQRLGLKVASSQTDHRVNNGDYLGVTEKYVFSVLGTSTETDFEIFNKKLNTSQDGDGVIPYWALAGNIVVFDIPHHNFTIAHQLGSSFADFIHAGIIKDDTKMLSLEIFDAQQKPAIAAIDSGQDTGITLPHAQWEAWIGAHPGLPTTLDASYMPSVGVSVVPEVWAPEFRIGDLVLHNIPVKEAISVEESNEVPGTSCIFGLYALTRFELILDGFHLTAYLRPTQGPIFSYHYNRLGAVFVPRNNQSNDLIAYVAKGSPAEAAGIVNGDVLIKVDRLRVAEWRTDPRIMPLSRFWEMPAGTEHTLVVRRGTKTQKIKVILKDFLAQNA